jgi:hypothetical protein
MTDKTRFRFSSGKLFSRHSFQRPIRLSTSPFSSPFLEAMDVSQ